MVRKLIFSGIGVFALVLVILGYQHFKSQNQVQANVWQSANPNAVVIMASSDFHQIWERLNETSLIWQELKLIPQVTAFNRFLSAIDSTIINSPALTEFSNLSDFLISIVPSGSTSADLVLSTAVSGSFDMTQLLAMLSITRKTSESKTYDGIDLVKFTLNQKTCFGAICKDLLLISPSSLVLEESIRNINRETDILQIPAFKNMKETAGQYAKANIYVNYKQLGWLLNNNMSSNYSNWAKTLANMGYWAALDLDLKSNSLILNGFNNCSDTSQHFLSVFNNQEPQKLSFKTVVPSNTALMLNIGVSSFTDYLDQYRNWLDSQGALFSYRKDLEKLNATFGARATALAITWIGNQLGTFYTEMASPKNIAQHKLLIFKADNILNAQRDLIELSQLAGINQNTETYRGKVIRALGVGNMYGKILGSAFSGMHTPYFTNMDDYIIIANNASTLRDVITKNAVEKTLSEDEIFKNFNNQLNSEGNVLIYGNLAGASKHIQAMLSSEIATWMSSENDRLANFQSFAFEWTKENQDLYYQHAIINYNPSYKQETGSLWELNLEGAELTTKPLFVKNHYSGNREVLVQDNEFNLYLISNVGKELWKKQLKEQIIGDPVQIDAYKNNKLQYVFVTKNQLHMVDRNGNNVEGFPRTLISRANTALAVFDYDNNRNYRMMVGCDDGKVYSYQSDGTMVEGWKFNRGNSAICGKIRHFTIGRKDYILIVEQNGIMHFVDRRGDSRHEMKAVIENQSLFNDLKLVLGKNIDNSFVYYTSRDGNLVKQQFNGDKTILDLDLPETHLFTMDDVNNDGNLEVICTKGKKLLILSTAGKIILEKEFDDSITGFLNTYHFPNNVKRIGFTIPSAKEIHLVNFLGENHQGFPLYGETDFSIADINKENIFSLVTAGSNGKIYTYNLK